MTEDEMSVLAGQIPVFPPSSDRAGIVTGIVEWWINTKHGGDAPLDLIVSATLIANSLASEAAKTPSQG